MNFNYSIHGVLDTARLWNGRSVARTVCDGLVAVLGFLVAMGHPFSIKSAESIRPGESDECTNLEYPIGVYYDFYYKNWFYKDWHKTGVIQFVPDVDDG